MTTDEQLQELRERLARLEADKVPPGAPEHRDLVALDRHFDVRCDTLSKRLDAIEARLPNPIPVVTPVTFGPQSAPVPDYRIAEPQLAYRCGNCLACEDGVKCLNKPSTLDEACELLQTWIDFCYGPVSEAPTRSPWEETKQFLARARVATKEP